LPKLISDSGIHASTVFALDLTLIVPAFLIGVVLRWGGHPAGAVAGVAMIVPGVLSMAARAFAGGFPAHAGISGKSRADPPWIELAITSLAACWLLPRHLTASAGPGARPTRSGRPAGLTSNR
jgi:hypothetical protein